MWLDLIKCHIYLHLKSAAFLILDLVSITCVNVPE